MVLLVGTLALFSAFFYGRIPRDPSVESMVLEDDPDLAAYRHFKEIFGSDEFFLAAVEGPDIFEAQFMEDLESLRAEMERIPHIREALAFTNVLTLRGTEDALVVEPLAPRIPRTEAERTALRERALAEKDFVGSLYTADGRVATIAARLETLAPADDTTQTRIELTRTVRALLAKAPYNRYRWYLAGVPVLKCDLAETQRKETRKFELINTALLILCLYVIFRTASGVAVTLGVVGASILVLMAAHYFSGIPLSMVSTILTPLMLIYGVSSCVHLQVHYALQYAEKKDQRRALVAAFSIALLPCFFNAATTAAGFASNMISPIRPIRDFGLFASCGVLLSFVISFAAGPAILSWLPPPGQAAAKVNESGLRVRAIEGILALIRRRTRSILAVNVLLLLVAAWGISRIRVETKMLEYFRPDSPIRSSYEFIEDRLTGISSLEILVDAGREEGLQEPEVFRAMERLCDELRAEEPSVSTVLSLGNFYRRLKSALEGDAPGSASLPATREEAAQLLLLYSMSGAEASFYNFASSDYRVGRISVRLRHISSTELQKVVDRVRSRAARIFGPLEEKGIRASVTGGAVLYANMNRSLLAGQLMSFGLSLGIITFLMILMAGEVGLGLISLIPNLLPIFWTMGLMGFLGYPLDSTTAMIAPIALGMAVDSTIHFLSRFRREYKKTQDHQKAMEQTLYLIGRAMIGTSLPLAAGFFVLTISVFRPVYAFGLLSGTVVILAMLLDLILTPICFLLYRPDFQRPGLLDLWDS